jgi:hypothetical protein
MATLYARLDCMVMLLNTAMQTTLRAQNRAPPDKDNES